MRRVPVVSLALLALAAARPVRAQDSVFGIRGLGFPTQPLTGRGAGMGGVYDPFDGGGVVNPASLAAWNGTVGWAVGAASWRRYDAGAGAVSLNSTRFPLFGFATPAGRRAVVGVSISDYLDRNWRVSLVDTVAPRDTAVAVNDLTTSSGGVSDIRIAAAYRLSERMTVGLGLHVLSGSTQSSVTRTFPSDSAYTPFSQVAVTDYSGVAVSAGALLTPLPRVILAGSVRINSRLRAAGPDTTAWVRLPVELDAAAYYSPTDRLIVAARLGRSWWSEASGDLVAAGQAAARDVWTAGVGVQVAPLRLGPQLVPLRAGYFWRQLPFAIGTSALSESGVTFGLGLAAAGGRANLDAALQTGSRAAGPLKETFTALLVGVSILP